tara:strand:- start:17718 stop:17993 length:276 start_codon:yes stop_codon:yes gene_type:complete
MSNSNEELSRMILDFLESDAKFVTMSPQEKSKVFRIYDDILESFYKCLIFDNVYPILLIHDYKTALFVKEVLEDTANLIPTLSRITVRTIS